MPVNYDASGVFLSAVIRTRDGDRFPFWLDAQASPGGRHQDRPFLSEVTVKLNLGNVPIITAQITPPYGDALALLDSPIMDWASQSMLEVQFGYKNSSPAQAILSQPFQGLILKPEVQLGEEVSVTLNAQGIPRFSYNTTGGLRTLAGSRAEIVAELLRGPDPAHPSPLKLDDRDVRLEGPGSVAYRALFHDVLGFSQGPRTDWQIITQLLWEARCYFVIVGAALKVLPMSISATVRPRRTFALGYFPEGRMGGSRNVYPILSASSPTLGVYLSTPPTLGTQRRSIDSGTGAVTPAEVSDRTVRPSRTGRTTLAQAPSNTAPGPSADNTQGPQFLPGDAANARSEAQAHAEWEARQSIEGIKLEIESIGIPDIMPGEVVTVQGLGAKLTGEYLIFDVTHTVGGGATTRLTMVSQVDRVLERAVQALGLANIGAASPRVTALLGDDLVDVSPSAGGLFGGL